MKKKSFFLTLLGSILFISSSIGQDILIKEGTNYSKEIKPSHWNKTKEEAAQSDIRKGWDGTVKGNKKAMSMLMGRPSNCTDVGACHNQISPLNPNGTPAEREVAIEFSIEDNQLVGKYLSRPIAKSDIFVTSEPILIEKKYIINSKTDIIILPNNHKSDPTLGKFGGVRLLFKSK